MTNKPYVPLHVHSEYSLLDGAIRINDLVNFAKENNMPAVALTDHGVMYGDMELYTTGKENGIKPILGSEFYVHDGDIEERSGFTYSDYIDLDSMRFSSSIDTMLLLCCDKVQYFSHN